jgi:hypothetical protein
MNVRGEENVLGLPTARRYCVLLIDGFGWHQLRANQAHAPFLSSLRGRSITVGAPTTTVTSITSLGTGLPPGRHGMVGYTSRVPGRNELFNALKWEPKLEPGEYQPYPSVFQRAIRAGVSASVVGQRAFRDSGLTSVALRGPYFGANSLGERVAAAANASQAGQESLVYVYDQDLDYTGHQAGCHSDAWRHQLAIVDRFAEELHDSLPSGTVFVVTGDHGMVDIDAGHRIDIDDISAMRDGVELVAGEARFRHVYTAEGATDDVVAAWRGVLGGRAQVLTRQEATQAGWFGAVEARVAERIGDVVVNVDGNCAIEYRSVFPIEAKLVGLHGALTEEELLVPLLVTTA